MSGAFLTDDLAAFFDEGEFADRVVFEGASTPVVGLFDKDFDLSQFGNVDVSSTAPVFTLPASSVPAAVQGRHLRFGNLLSGGSRYRVVDARSANPHITILILEEA